MLYMSKFATLGGNQARLCVEANSLIARMTTKPTLDRQIRINRLIVDLKNAGVWAALEWLYVFAAADSQAALLNWVGSDTATNGGLGFTADRGYLGDGTHTITGLNSLPNFSAVHVGAWCNVVVPQSGIPNPAVSATFDTGTYLIPSDGSGKARGATVGATEMVGTAGPGYLAAVRYGATDQRLFYNGNQIATSTAGTGSTGSQPAKFLGQNTGDRIAVAHGGRSSLSVAQIAATYAALSEYLTAIGGA